jgi:hypothetical protein
MWLQTTNFFVAGQRYLIRRIEERSNIVLQTNTEIVALEGDITSNPFAGKKIELVKLRSTKSGMYSS